MCNRNPEWRCEISISHTWLVVTNLPVIQTQTSEAHYPKRICAGNASPFKNSRRKNQSLYKFRLLAGFGLFCESASHLRLKNASITELLVTPKGQAEGKKDVSCVTCDINQSYHWLLDFGGLLSLGIRENVRRKVVEQSPTWTNYAMADVFLKKTNLKWIYPSMIRWFVIGMLSGWSLSTFYSTIIFRNSKHFLLLS